MFMSTGLSFYNEQFPERGIGMFEACAAAQARGSLARGESREAARHLAALHAQRGGWLLGAAACVLELAPALGVAAYRLREAVRS